MESFGKLLQDARLEKNLDIEKVAREISIERKYLQALEEENSSVFPGEAYMIGFLRNYSNYLELDTDFILKLYNNKKIQESPVPEGLLEKPKSRWLVPVIVIPIVFIVGVAVTVLVLLLTRKTKVSEEEVVVSNQLKTRQYQLTDKKFSQRVYKGDQILVSTENGQIVLTVRDTLSSFGLDTPSGVYYTDLAEETEIDIDGDSKPDLIIYVADISYTDASRGVEVNMLLRNGLYNQRQSNSSVDELSIPLASDLKSKHPQKVIIEDNRAYPFTINASFRGPCLFRHKVDNSETVETYFTRGEVFTATPKNGIRLWISNNNTVKFSLIADSKTFDLDIGAAGQVFVEDIKWIKDTDGKYKLVVIELD
ncbi:MAG: helix-turn-helix domain-containing protein [Treponema sp.]|nr:helix-turn-helix domain-containing protein [Treponema sp.]